LLNIGRRGSFSEKILPSRKYAEDLGSAFAKRQRWGLQRFQKTLAEFFAVVKPLRNRPTLARFACRFGFAKGARLASRALWQKQSPVGQTGRSIGKPSSLFTEFGV